MSDTTNEENALEIEAHTETGYRKPEQLPTTLPKPLETIIQTYPLKSPHVTNNPLRHPLDVNIRPIFYDPKIEGLLTVYLSTSDPTKMIAAHVNLQLVDVLALNEWTPQDPRKQATLGTVYAKTTPVPIDFTNPIEYFEVTESDRPKTPGSSQATSTESTAKEQEQDLLLINTTVQDKLFLRNTKAIVKGKTVFKIPKKPLATSTSKKTTSENAQPKSPANQSTDATPEITMEMETRPSTSGDRNYLITRDKAQLISVAVANIKQEDQGKSVRVVHVRNKQPVPTTITQNKEKEKLDQLKQQLADINRQIEEQHRNNHQQATGDRTPPRDRPTRHHNPLYEPPYIPQPYHRRSRTPPEKYNEEEVTRLAIQHLRSIGQPWRDHRHEHNEYARGRGAPYRDYSSRPHHRTGARFSNYVPRRSTEERASSSYYTSPSTENNTRPESH
jgi:hypothetical protein